MDLPGDSIGISDIKQWRECPRRMNFGMARHTEEGELPESEGPNTAYGSAIHDVVHLIEVEDLTDDQACQTAFDRYGTWLEPDDLDRLKKDIATYHERNYVGVRTVAAEDDLRVPLMVHDGKQIYFRFKLDRLYQRLDDEGAFIHIDYKSSKWPRTAREVHEDKQLWAYNWAIHEMWPECDRLEQIYDQLMHGPEPTRKNDEQRAQIKEWLQRQALAIIKDERVEDDGLPKAKFNNWCAYCPILTSCPVVPRLSHFAQTKLAVMREGVEGLDTGDTLPDPDEIRPYIERFEIAKDGSKALEAYEDEIKKLLRRLPRETREELGYKLSPRRTTQFSSEALRTAHGLLGDDFYSLITLGKTKVEEYPMDDRDREAVLDLGSKVEGGSPAVTKIKKK